MSNNTPQHTPADVREQIKAAIRDGVRYVAKADGAYLYEPSVDETADRILALLRTPRGEGERVKEAWATVEAAALAQANLLDSHYGGQPAQAAEIRNAVEQVAALLRTPRGDGEAAAMSASLSRAFAAMQAAWIEWRRGRGADAAMQWIENTLIGPGLIPGDVESDAQAFFDRAIAEIENHQIRQATALRSDAQGEDRWEDVVVEPITQAYNEAHAARRGEGGGK